MQDAFEQARTALALEHHDQRECPELVARADVDPAQLFLLRGPAKYLAPRSSPAALEGDVWRELPPLLAHLYPSGPLEEHVWDAREETPPASRPAAARTPYGMAPSRFYGVAAAERPPLIMAIAKATVKRIRVGRQATTLKGKTRTRMTNFLERIASSSADSKPES